jgi:hypothetical protein
LYSVIYLGRIFIIIHPVSAKVDLVRAIIVVVSQSRGGGGGGGGQRGI